MHLKVILPLMNLAYILHAQQNRTMLEKVKNNVKIAWTEKPPYTIKLNGSTTGKPDGLLKKTVWHFVELGCGRYDVHIEDVEVDNMATVKSLVHEGKAHIGLPFFKDNFGNYEGYEGLMVMPVLEHPGLEFISTRQDPNGLFIILKAVVQCWPLLVVTMLLTAIAGVIVWALVRFYFFLCYLLGQILEFASGVCY